MDPVGTSTRIMEAVVQHQDGDMNNGGSEAASGRTAPNAAEKNAEQQTALDDESIEKIAKGVDDFLKLIQTNLKVEIHKETNTAIFKIIRKNDNKVIKEVPPRAMLDIAVKIKDMVGSLVDANA